MVVFYLSDSTSYSDHGISLIDDFGHFLYSLILTDCYEDAGENTAPEIKFIKKSKVFNKQYFTGNSLKVLPVNKKKHTHRLWAILTVAISLLTRSKCHTFLRAIAQEYQSKVC